MSKPGWLPSLLRGLLFAVVALVPLYVLSGPPATVLMMRTKSESMASAIAAFYDPMWQSVRGTPFGDALVAYEEWCFRVENKRFEQNEPEPPLPD